MFTHRHVDIIQKWPTGPVDSNEAGLGLPPSTKQLKRLIQSARSRMPMTAREVRNLCPLAEQTSWTNWTIQHMFLL